MTEGKSKEIQKGYRLKNSQFVQTYCDENSEYWEPVNILTDEELEAEREEIAREAWDRAKQRKTITNWLGVDMSKIDKEVMVEQHEERFQDYWQQKQKERIE